ncbi:unnamed protein product [Peniophora sp. CBMAI 1063]|nr:unnamed protein product [Peniophora sp. CBMAI 1063]
MTDNFVASQTAEKRCFCSSCGPDGFLLPLSTYKNHQRDVELGRQRLLAQKLFSTTKSKATSDPPPAAQPLYGESSLDDLAYDSEENSPPSASITAPVSMRAEEAAGLLEELRSSMTPTYLDGLEFSGYPATDGPYVLYHALGDGVRSDGPYMLVPNCARNRLQLSRENRVRILQAYTADWEPSSSRDEVLQMLKVVSDFLEVQKALAWSLQRNAYNSGIVCTDVYYNIPIPHRDEPFLSACFMTAMLLSTFGSLSQKDAKILLAGFRAVAARSSTTHHLVRRIPRDVRDVLSQFDAWDPVVERYITCPSCFEQYPLTAYSASTLPGCISQETPLSNACGASLWSLRGESQKLSPIVVTVLHQFKHWLGRQLSRLVIENACEEAFTSPPEDPMRREKDGTRVWLIRDSDGTAYLPGPPSELRTVFSWSNDGWNPYGNKLSGVSRTSTGFWLINMGLPLDIRYLEENMFYFGAVPGKPNGSRLNPTLDILVNAFLEFWSPGVWYSRTAKRPAGRLIRSALIPQISDVIASRQAAGRGAVNLKRHFCLFCLLNRDHIECSDRATFEPRDDELQRAQALLWKDAASEDDRKTLEKENDIRYTPMFRLPYHRATLDNIPEPLHLFYEYLLQVVIRHCLRIHYVVDGQELSEVIKDPKHPRPPPPAMNVALTILREAPDGELSKTALNKLEACSEDVLWNLCQDYDLRHAGFKRQLVLNLAAWRRTVTADDVRLEALPGESISGTPGVQHGSVSQSEPGQAISSSVHATHTSESEDSQSHTEGSLSTVPAMDIDDEGTDHAHGNATALQFDMPHVMATATPERPAWLWSLTSGELRALCTPDAEKVRVAFNRSRKVRTIANHCNGNKAILVAFAKVLGLANAAEAGNPRTAMSAIALTIKEHLIANTIAIQNVRPTVEAFLSTTPGAGQTLPGESSNVLQNAASSTGQTIDPPAQAWLAGLTPEERRLMQTPQAMAVGEHLVKGNAPATIISAARTDQALSTDLLQAFCKSLGLASHGNGTVLAERLKAYTESMYSPAPPKVTRLMVTGPRREILTTSIMLRIKETIARTQMPSSADKTPSDWGTKGHGRITGGQWLVIGTVHLPITLIPLWGHPSASQHERDLLEFYMTTVAVVCIGTLRVISLADTVDFDDAAQQYFEGKKRLFKDETIRPYDHLLLHYGDVLRWYGPSAAHDGSFYERHIRRLHGLNINMKSGEIEATYLQGASRHANLRSFLLDDNALPTRSHVSELVEEFRHQSFADTRGTKLGSLLLESMAMRSREGAIFLKRNTSEVTLSSSILNVLIPQLGDIQEPASSDGLLIASALRVKAASFRGARYCPASEVECDSDMIYSLDDDPSHATGGGRRLLRDKIATGRIVYLFLHGHSPLSVSTQDHSRTPSGSLWAVVHTYEPLRPDELHLDAHYRSFEFGGFCCKPGFIPGSPKVVNISRILCQVAKVPVTSVGIPLLHFLPLARLTNALPHVKSSLHPEPEEEGGLS